MSVNTKNKLQLQSMHTTPIDASTTRRNAKVHVCQHKKQATITINTYYPYIRQHHQEKPQSPCLSIQKTNCKKNQWIYTTETKYIAI